MEESDISPNTHKQILLHVSATWLVSTDDLPLTTIDIIIYPSLHYAWFCWANYNKLLYIS